MYRVMIDDYEQKTTDREEYGSKKAALAAADTLLSFFSSPERVGTVDVRVQVHRTDTGECILNEGLDRPAHV